MNAPNHHDERIVRADELSTQHDTDIEGIISSALERAGVGDDDVWMRRRQFGKAADASMTTVWRIERAGKIRVFRDDGRIRIAVADVRKYLRERLTGAKAA